jgi:hypothetical protein
MDQSNTQPRGDFVAFLNRDKQPGDNRPIFEGRLAKPGSDEKVPLTLWAHEYTDPRTGEVKTMYSGTIGAVSPDASASDQISALTRSGDAGEQSLGNLSLRPRQVVLFPNGFKADAPDKNRPDLWGAVNFGDGSPIARSSVWLGKTRSGEVMLTGATSYPLPGKSEGEMQAADPELVDIIAKREVSKGMPDKKKGRGRD